MPRALKVGLAAVAGLVLGEAAAILGYVIATNFLSLVDRDGGAAMGAIFVLGPALAVVFALTGALVVAGRTRSTG